MRNRQFVTSIHLRPSGHSGSKMLHPLLCTQLNKIILIIQCWRGPTRLISPLKILQSWGNSSRLDFRSTPPTGVRYCSGSVSKCVATAGVSRRIVRNFGMRNILSPRPIRSDQYRTGPGDVSFTSPAISNIGSPASMSSIMTKKISSVRFPQ